ncbi:hypothetical protein [Rhodanobacter lindaniclasticus]|uniref:hypothetical protein n=1 Tax=Rhodanobacter lindaniclasticus TaxID=75310 RepID=UPI00109FE6DF|nr:hypothetical protein [Rhodanobacter lindaniclasticus]
MNLSTVFDTEHEAREYADKCSDGTEVVPLYTRPATAASPAGVPDGYVLVPREPTRVMLEAMMNEQDSADGEGPREVEMLDIYRAMLAAAPSAESGEVEIDRARFKKAPCYLCGYNGHGYYQAETHPCAAKYHAASSAESGADGEVCQHTWVTDGINPTRCSKCRRPATTLSAESGEVDRG